MASQNEILTVFASPPSNSNAPNIALVKRFPAGNWSRVLKEEKDPFCHIISSIETGELTTRYAYLWLTVKDQETKISVGTGAMLQVDYKQLETLYNNTQLYPDRIPHEALEQLIATGKKCIPPSQLDAIHLDYPGEDTLSRL